MDLLNQHVSFRLTDIYFPEPAKLVEELYGSAVLEGRVIGLSDCGKERDVFVLVAVERVREIVIVPIKNIIGTI
jgi:hypothetical protein